VVYVLFREDSRDIFQRGLCQLSRECLRNKGVTRVLRGCYRVSRVARVLQGCYKGVTMVLRGKGVTIVS
jgi:hypothetical protein